jgi:hypothetical protein
MPHFWTSFHSKTAMGQADPILRAGSLTVAPVDERSNKIFPTQRSPPRPCLLCSKSCVAGRMKWREVVTVLLSLCLGSLSTDEPVVGSNAATLSIKPKREYLPIDRIFWMHIQKTSAWIGDLLVRSPLPSPTLEALSLSLQVGMSRY